MITAGEVLLATGLALGVGAAGGFAGDVLVRSNIPSATAVSDAKRDMGAAQRAYEDLTDPGSCERGVLVSISTNEKILTQTIGAEVVERALTISCGHDQNADDKTAAQYHNLAAQAAQSLETVASATQHYSFLESRSENPTRDRAVGVYATKPVWPKVLHYYIEPKRTQNIIL